MSERSVPVEATLDPESGDLILTSKGEWWQSTTTRVPAATLDFFQRQSAAVRNAQTVTSPLGPSNTSHLGQGGISGE